MNSTVIITEANIPADTFSDRYTSEYMNQAPTEEVVPTDVWQREVEKLLQQSQNKKIGKFEIPTAAFAIFNSLSLLLPIFGLVVLPAVAITAHSLNKDSLGVPGNVEVTKLQKLINASRSIGRRGIAKT